MPDPNTKSLLIPTAHKVQTLKGLKVLNKYLCVLVDAVISTDFCMMNPVVASTDANITTQLIDSQPFPAAANMPAPLGSPARAGPVLPNPSKLSPSKILTDIDIHDLHKYATEDYLRSPVEQGNLPQGNHLEDKHNIPGDRTSIRMGMLGDAARIGNRTQQHSLLLVKNMEAYLGRNGLEVANDILCGNEEIKFVQAAGTELERLIDDLTRGKV